MLRSIIRPVYYLQKDFFFNLSNKNPMIPPPSKVTIGDGDFVKIGKEFAELFKNYGGLKSEHSVLDIGCGIGRMAIPLTEYLYANSEYYGFDIMKDCINWASQKITPSHPNFKFIHSDVINTHYNPKGKYQSIDFKFPFKDESFDFSYLTSVFTHMYYDEILHYLKEIKRVLKPGGKCFTTIFLLNEESNSLMKEPKSTFNFSKELDKCYTATPKDPARAIAFKEEVFSEMVANAGLKWDRKAFYGSWCGREKFVSFQDFIIITK